MSATTAPILLRLADEATLLHADGRTLALEAKDALLLAYLAIEGPTPRAALAALLWPEADGARARGNLRQRLMRLRQSVGMRLVVGAAQLALADEVAHDLAGAHGVLGGLRFPDAPTGDAWLCGQRERQSSALRQSIERQAEALERAGELSAALPVAQALLRLEPLSEAAHRRVMRLHYLRGDRAEALLAFDRCERMLKDDVGAKPSSETMALLQTLEQVQAPAWVPGQALPASALRPPRLIGRAAELTALASAWVAEQAFVVTGPAGSGKSRLLDAIADADASLLMVRARPGDDKVPLATLDRLVQRLAQRWPVLGAVPAYARFLTRGGGPAQGQPPSVQLVAPLVASLIEAARANGLGALVLDDLQFADEASADTWQELVLWPTLAGLRFGFASRLDNVAAQSRV
jgi:DNA-binding SARP family transcriptional activator